MTDATKYDGNTLGDLLGIVGSEDSVLTSEVKAFLATMYDDSLELLMSLTGLKLAQRIKMSEEAITNPGAVATRIRQLVNEHFSEGTPSAAQAGGGTQTIKVEMPISPESMDLETLLLELIKNQDKPGAVAFFVPRINQQPVVVAAVTRLGHERWAIAGGDGLDVSRTLRYVALVANPDRMIPSGRWEDQVPTTLKKALGLEIRTMIFPFAIDPDDLLFDGIDMNGNDWTELDTDTYEAMIYHALFTRKLTVSNELERDRLLDDLFNKIGMSSLLTRFVDQYVIYLDGDDSKRMHRYMSRAQLDEAFGQKISKLGIEVRGGRHPFGGSTTPVQPVRDEDWYKAQLKDAAEAAVDQIHTAVRRRDCIIDGVSTVNGNIKLTEVICLGDVTSVNGNISGPVYMHLRASVGSTHGNIGEVYRKNWEGLYNKAIEWSIIKPS